MQIEGNNIFAVGCSFTWGESLQFFSGLDSVVWKEIRPSFPDAEKTLDNAQLNFIKENRWVAQLAKKLGVEYITQSKNGGTNLQSLLKVKYFYENEENVKNYKICILQITQFVRDPIMYKFPDGEYIALQDVATLMADFDILKIKDKDIVMQSYQYFYDKCLEFFERLKKKGVTPYVICYPKDSSDVLQRHDLFKYHIPLTYNNESFNSTDELCAKYPILVIENYFRDKNLNKNDNHMTLDGHKIISNSIYSKIIIDNK
jgi:hypothetical protein